MANQMTSILVDKYARRYGVPISLARNMLSKESGGDPKAVSPKKAVGLLQIHLPSHPSVTRAQAEDPDFNLNYGFAYLSKLKQEFGSWRLALAAYNAGPGAVRKYGGVPPYGETQDYVRTILRASGALGGVAKWADAPASSPGAFGRAGSTPASATDLEGLQSLAAGRYDPSERLQSLLSAGSSNGRTPGFEPGSGGSTPSPAAHLPMGSDPGKWVKIPQPRGEWPPPGPEIIGFVAQLAQSYGKPLTAWDTTAHSRLTVNGKVSAHTVGKALDIPATGKTLKRLGYLALMRAGMPRAEAFKAAQRGGLFNVGGFQVIFATNEGGNHHNHIHIGIRE